MAKHVFVIRHAKSDWSFGVSDIDRPLNARGFDDAPRMADRLAAYHTRPQLLISSPAKRALTTAQVFAARLGTPVANIRIGPEIYEAHRATLLAVINEMDDQYNEIALFGHNPGFTDLVNWLADGHVANMPTCSIAHLQFDVEDWASVSGGLGELVWFAYPKEG